MRTLVLAAALLWAGLFSAASPALAAGPDGEALDCASPAILQQIEKRFAHAERHLHKSGLDIVSLTRVHQHRFEEAGKRKPIARRYCGATALMNDGRKRNVWYVIEDGMGFAGYGDTVEFCISGLDPLRAYGGHCRVLR
jgi:hypothetical protein